MKNSAGKKKLRRIKLLLKRRIVLALAASLGIAFFSKTPPGWQSNQMMISAATSPENETAQLFVAADPDSEAGIAERWLETRRRAMLSDYLANRSVPSTGKEAEAIPVLTFSIPEQFRAKIIRKVSIPNNQKVIALTFDDGPWPSTTQQIIDTLEKYQVDATFFWVGQHLRNHPEEAKQIAIAGHAIGNHTWHHQYGPVDPTTAANEIENTEVWINRIAGSRTYLFRPPGGRLDNGLAAYAQKRGYAVIMWSIDPQDSNRSLSAQTIAERVLTKANPGDIILLHDGGADRDATVKALPIIIQGLRKQGYRFVTVPQLLEMATQQSVAQAN